MNRIKNEERERIHQRAMQIVKLDKLDDGSRCTNARAAEIQLMDEFDITRQRARSHVAKAARRLRTQELVGWLP